MGGLLHHHDPRPGPACAQRSLKPRHTAAHHQDIHRCVEMFIGIRIRCLGIRCPAQPRRLANERLIDMFPKRPRIEEHLVIKPSRQKPRQIGIYRPDIELKAWPMVLAPSNQTVKQLRRRRPLVWLGARTDPHIHQGIRLFDPRGHNAARTVILERPPHHHLVIGQQGRGKRIALKPGQALPVERERHLSPAIE